MLSQYCSIYIFLLNTHLLGLLRLKLYSKAYFYIKISCVAPPEGPELRIYY